MPFLGTIIDFVIVLVAGLLGSCLKRGVPVRFSQAVSSAIAVCILFIGIEGALAEAPVLAEDAFFSPGLVKILIVVLSMVLGTLVGELLNIEGALERLGAFAEKKFAAIIPEDTSFARGFVSCSLLFGVGAMALNGALLDGIGQNDLLIAKAIIDGIMCFTMATSLGIGCAFSAVSLLVYEGAFALLSYFGSAILPEASLSYMSIVGSLVIILIATNSMGLTKVRTANMIPTMLIPFALVPLFQAIL